MQKWEYWFLHVDYDGMVRWSDAPKEKWEAAANRAGEAGWELVALKPGSGAAPGYTIIFKRPKEE